MSRVLEIENLHVAVRGGRGTADALLLRGVDIAIEAGEVHALVGESGAGKSMVGHTLLGILPPRIRVVAGRIGLLGLDWLSVDERIRRSRFGKDVALIPQDPLSALNPTQTIGRQMARLLRRHRALHRAAVPDRAEMPDRAAALLDAVRIRSPRDVLRQYPHELSGGMRQRVLIAMAFAARPRLIIADEPTTALDVTVQREILRLLRSLQHQDGAAVLFITHSLGIVAKLADRVSVIHAGRIVETGPVESIFSAPASPYTRALFAATPRYDRPAEALRPIEASVTDALWQDAHDYDRRYFGRHG